MENHKYLLRLKFLGFRYSGWQHQPGTRTVEGMLHKTLKFILPGKRFKLLGAGRTDARVSASDFGAQFTLYGQPVDSESSFLEQLNRNLPPDISVLSVEKVPPEFNVIRDTAYKSYRYYFTYGDKPHPFSTPLLGYFSGNLDIGLMLEGAEIYKGRHNFSAFITRPSAETQLIRTVLACRIEENLDLKASFFPEVSYFLEVGGSGFGRNQVRRMMTALIALGRGELTTDLLKESLKTGSSLGLRHIAPASGLQLTKITYVGKDR